MAFGLTTLIGNLLNNPLQLNASMLSMEYFDGNKLWNVEVTWSSNNQSIINRQVGERNDSHVLTSWAVKLSVNGSVLPQHA